MTFNIKEVAIKEEWYIFVCAIQFLTRIPVSTANAYSESRMQEATRYYPLVGVLVGLLGAVVFQLLSLLLPVLPSLILMICATIWLTGAFHEDGFADMCDGIGGGHTKEQMLGIMRDSRLGTYGVVGIMMLLLIKLSLLWNLVTTDTTIFLTAFVVAHCLSRASAVLVIATSRYVRDAGVAKPVAGFSVLMVESLPWNSVSELSNAIPLPQQPRPVAPTTVAAPVTMLSVATLSAPSIWAYSVPSLRNETSEMVAKPRAAMPVGPTYVPAPVVVLIVSSTEVLDPSDRSPVA